MNTLPRKFCLASLVALILLANGTNSLRAQDNSQTPAEVKPKPAGTSFPLVGSGGQDDLNSGSNNNLTPDNTPLTGVQTPTLGSPPVLHSYWQPGIQWSGSIQSSSYNQSANSGWVMNNYFIGNVSLLKVWSGSSQLALNYSGGGFFSSDSSQGGGSYHQLALSQTFHWNRWLIQLLDQFSYLPQSAFGFGGGTGLGIPGGGGTIGPPIPGIGNGYVPNQSVLGTGSQYSNASTVQLTYTTTPRGSITFSGTYGLLNFVNPGNIDNDTIIGTVGYNYALTREDSIGAFYRFSAFHFPGQPFAYGDHSINLAYSRKITGRLALQLFGGPDFTTSRATLTNPATVIHGVNAGGNMQYGFQKGGVSLGYIHGIAGGSGVLTGSSLDQINGTASHNLGRIWSGQLTGAYAHNTPIAALAQTNSQSYDTYTVGGGISRAAGRNGSFAVAYNATISSYGPSGCVGTVCSSSQTFHYITISYQWHTRPFVLP